MDVMSMIGTAVDLMIVIVGFGLIIFVHELGHFLAAKWAGIRVLAFAVGFGPAIVAYRRGLGWRRGTTEPDVARLRQRAASDDVVDRDEALRRLRDLDHTEYRLNWLPFGGYVKMLGQEDLNPSAVSAESDSYQRCPVWKRMVVISAGVVMNVITAAALFIFVFMVGLKTEPAVVGHVFAGLPASRAVATNASAAGVTEAGLKPGDRLVKINGRQPNSFNDLVLASLMARRGGVVNVEVLREGYSQPIAFSIRPETSRLTGLMEIGVEPPRSTRVVNPRKPGDREQWRAALARIGLEGVEPGMALVRVGGEGDVRSSESIDSAFALIDAVRESRGAPVPLEFAAADGRLVRVAVTPEPQFESHIIDLADGSRTTIEHLLGLTAVLKVAAADTRAKSQGLADGDVFIRVGEVEYPGIAAGIEQIRLHKGRRIDVIVHRSVGDGRWDEVNLQPRVSSKGLIGFSAGDTSRESSLLAMPPARMTPIRDGTDAVVPAARRIVDRPGLRLIRVNDREVSTLADAREALRSATDLAVSLGEGDIVSVTFELPIASTSVGGPLVETRAWELSAEEVRSLHSLGWSLPFSLGIFEPEQFTLRASGPLGAIGMGIAETHRVMMMTYLTIVRLFEGTVRVEHLKGPVGIAHLGTRIAERGVIWLLFFMALISVNLAVINFLPLPIVDGGQFLFLIAERIRGKPVPAAVQNITTFVGILLIGAVFLIVTFNDIVNLFTGG